MFPIPVQANGSILRMMGCVEGHRCSNSARRALWGARRGADDGGGIRMRAALWPRIFGERSLTEPGQDFSASAVIPAMNRLDQQTTGFSGANEAAWGSNLTQPGAWRQGWQGSAGC